MACGHAARACHRAPASGVPPGTGIGRATGHGPRRVSLLQQADHEPLQ